jgi:hypothetical protein
LRHRSELGLNSVFFILSLLSVSIFLSGIISYEYVTRFSGVPTSSRAAVLDPFNSRFRSIDGYQSSIDAIIKHLESANYTVEYYRDGEVSLDVWRKICMGSYGVIYLNTHGYIDQDGYVYVYLGELVRGVGPPILDVGISYLPLEEGVDEVYIVVFPEFIRYYGRMSEKSIIFVDACLSAYNPTMASAFIEVGAGCYVGWSGSVGVAVGARIDAEVFEHLAQGDTIFTALSKSGIDPITTARLIAYGDPYIALIDTGYRGSIPILVCIALSFVSSILSIMLTFRKPKFIYAKLYNILKWVILHRHKMRCI